MKINRAYLHLFKRSNNCYLLQIKKGIYLAFDKQDYHYIGVKMFYAPKNINYYETIADRQMYYLFNKGILELF